MEIILVPTYAYEMPSNVSRWKCERESLKVKSMLDFHICVKSRRGSHILLHYAKNIHNCKVASSNYF